MPDSKTGSTTMPSVGTSANLNRHQIAWASEREAATTAFKSHNESLMQLANSRLSFEPKSKLSEYFWKDVNDTMTNLVALNGPEYSHLFPSENPRFGLPGNEYKAE
jgi:hypothetical protein